MIEISELRFSYATGGFALHVPALEVAAGEQVAVIGPSGSGKTTLLHLIAGIRQAGSGSVAVDGVAMSDLGDADRREFRVGRIGLVFQEFELLEYLTVLDNILLPYRISGALRLGQQVRERARGLAREVGIADKLGRRPGQLSQGERQRVAVCRALIAEPRVLLADEPTGNLDPTNKDRVLDSLIGAAAASGATLVTVTHDHDLLDRFERVVDFKAFYDTGEAASDESPQGARP